MGNETWQIARLVILQLRFHAKIIMSCKDKQPPNLKVEMGRQVTCLWGLRSHLALMPLQASPLANGSSKPQKWWKLSMILCTAKRKFRIEQQCHLCKSSRYGLVSGIVCYTVPTFTEKYLYNKFGHSHSVHQYHVIIGKCQRLSSDCIWWEPLRKIARCLPLLVLGQHQWATASPLSKQS